MFQAGYYSSYYTDISRWVYNGNGKGIEEKSGIRYSVKMGNANAVYCMYYTGFLVLWNCRLSKCLETNAYT